VYSAHTHIQIYVFPLLLRLIKVDIGYYNNLCACIRCIISTYVLCLSHNMGDVKNKNPIRNR